MRSMKKETAGEVIGHPLWLLPVLLIGMLALIEGLHTSAHLHQNMDVHGICRQNKEYIEMKENEY